MTIHKAWEELFARHDILSRVAAEGVFRISATEINTVKEARLMAKFDKSSQLPEVFKSNRLSILPVSRGDYLIGHFKTHGRIVYPDVKPTPVEIPDLQSLDHTNLYSEASALLFALNSGIVQDMLGSSKVHYTVNGRMSSGAFQFRIEDSAIAGAHHAISVANAQIEIDAGYESEDVFCICEAKNIATEELLIRQLYYPYRLWKSRIAKEVLPLFLVFSNDVFHLFRYAFEDILHYNSIRLAEHRSYTFADEKIRLQEVKELWSRIPVIPEPGVTFPQADSFERVLDLLSVLFETPLTLNEVTLQYEFDPRQTYYYTTACRYLDLIEYVAGSEGESVFQLTEDARAMLSMRYKQKHLALIRKLLERPVFHKAFGVVIASGGIPDRNTICQIMRECALPISGDTIPRRSSTVRAWLSWIIGICAAD